MKNRLKSLKNHLSSLSVAIILLVSVVMTLNFAVWDTKLGVIQSDVVGYYSYLPASLIFHDLQFGFLEDHREDMEGKLWYRETADHVRFIQYTSGVAICYLPSFLTAHLLAPSLGYRANGYTLPYEMAIQWNSILFLLLSLIFFRKLLKKYFPDPVVAITLIVVVLGTNLIYYATREGPVSHLYSFTFITLFLWFLSKWIEERRWRDALILGFVTGMVILIRPTNIIIVLLFGLWGVRRWTDLRERLLFLLKNWYFLLVMVVVAFMVWVPQFLYWHSFSGQWFFNSYIGEGAFFWDDPQIINILFSYRKGWLLYTPMMVLSFVGLPFLYKVHKQLFWPILILLVLIIYLLASWCFWWYGGSYGGRPFVDFYALFAFPIAAFLHVMFQKYRRAIPTLLVLGVLVYHNFFQIQQYSHMAIHWISMTKEAYWDSFGRKWPSREFFDMLEYPDYESVRARVAEKQRKKHK